MAKRQGAKARFDYAGYFREMQVLHDLTTPPQEMSWLGSPPKELEHHDVVLYLGCNVLRTSHMIRTVTDVFDLLDVDYITVGGPAYCCGVTHDRFGDSDVGLNMARNTVSYFERFTPERVVMWCPSCIFTYDEIFQVPASFETLHVTEFLAEHLPSLQFVQEVPGRVALHYHSNRPRRLQEAAAAETLLSAVPGLDYVHIDTDERLERACSQFSQGGIGVEAWREIVEGQLAQAREAGADIFATIYHGCQRMLCQYEESQPLAVEHYLSVFARGLGIDHEDTFKKYKLWHDPDRALAEMAPCMTANGIDAAEAHTLVHRTFP